jgi:hydroxymethylpyrimidine/phosphomethylpyrimidine kinase
MSVQAYNDPPVVLTVAGFDPSGGAGIIADIETILSFGCRPVAAITSLTFQNSHEVFGATHETGESLRAQLLPILAEHSVAAVKIGMLPTAEIALEIAGLIADSQIPKPVVDPVMQSSSGFDLVAVDALEVLISELMPQARVFTPNIPEAEKLTGRQIEDEQGMIASAQQLRQMGARAVLIKGGHLRADPAPESARQAVDLLDNEGQITIFRSKWLDAQPLRGSGCRLSAGIAAGLAMGMTLEDAIRSARDFVASKFNTETEVCR